MHPIYKNWANGRFSVPLDSQPIRAIAINVSVLCTNYVTLLEWGGGRGCEGSVTHDVIVTKSVDNCMLQC